MKKAIAFFLLTIFLYNTAGYFIVFKIQESQIKSEIKNEIESGVDQNEITKLIVPNNNSSMYELADGGNEIRFNNQFFDIIKTNKTSTSTIYYCVNDKKEESLFSKLENQVDSNVISNTHQKNETSKKLIDTVIKLYFSNHFSITSKQTPEKITYYTSNLIYTPAIAEINSPPPEQV